MDDMRTARPAPVITDDAVYAPMLSESLVRYAGDPTAIVPRTLTHAGAFARALDEAEHNGLPLVMSANQMFDDPAVVAFAVGNEQGMRGYLACGRIRLMPLPGGRSYEDYVEGAFAPGFSSSACAAACAMDATPESYEADSKDMLLGLARYADEHQCTTARLPHESRDAIGYTDALDELGKLGCAAPLAGCKSRSEAYSRIERLPESEQDALYAAADAVYDAVCMHNSGLAGFAFDAASVACSLGHDPRPDCSIATLRDVSPSQELGL